MRTLPLDAAVAAAYGWSADISDDEVLRESTVGTRDRFVLFCAAPSGAKAKLGSWGTVARVTDASPALGVDRGCLDDALGGWV